MKAVTSLSGSKFIGTLVLALALLGAPVASSAAVFVSVAIAPPALPVYVQPVVPGAGYIWVPGYWAYGPYGYYWVPGTWVFAPYAGALWTPGYWGWGGAAYLWHPGYWGPRVGFYGGINYGFGYTGVGYYGGYWDRGAFYYNTAVNNVNVTSIRNTYTRDVVENASASRVSHNGGAGGIAARPTAEERLAERDQHRAWTPVQAQHERAASSNRAQLASVNNGAPAVAATPRANAFRERNAATRGGNRGNAGPGGTPPGSDGSRVTSSHPNKELRMEQQNRRANAGPPPVQGTPPPQGRAKNMPHPQAQAREGKGGGQRREEGKGR
jgi:hypothetical protein